MAKEWDKHIQEQFDNVLKYSQDISTDLHTDEIFETWVKNKSWFWEKTGGQLIYECPIPITLEMDNSSKENRINNFIDSVMDISTSLGFFLRQQKEGFLDNKVVINYYLHNEEIPAGMKINKAIGRYWKDELAQSTINGIQMEMSSIIQENRVNGILCLSVHPLDYLSVSENQHNWRSCHALDGEFRAGNLSYMMDKCTIIAYIKSEKDAELPRFPSSIPWNNKKWRCLFFFDKSRGLVYAGRQYPFFSKSALDLVRQYLFEPNNYFIDEEINKIYNGIPWRHNCVDGYFTISGDDEFQGHFSETHIFFGGTCTPLKKIVNDAPDSMQYNDLLKSSFYKPWTLRYNHTRFISRPPLMVGHCIPCPTCGKLGHTVCNSDVIMCEDCVINNPNIEREWIVNCARCDERIIADFNYFDGEHYYCKNCVDELTTCCADCGRGVFSPSGTLYHGKDGRILCYDCYHEQLDKLVTGFNGCNFVSPSFPSD